MADTGNEFNSEERQALSSEELKGMLHEYADVIDNFSDRIEQARRLQETHHMIDAVNQHLDRSVFALYAENYSVHGRTYLYHEVGDEGEKRWEKLYGIIFQGIPRPFIGDTLVVTDDGNLLLADTNRNLATDNVCKLTIRPKGDEYVQHYSEESEIEKLKKLGAVATEQGKTALFATNRWLQEMTDPPLD